MAEATEEKQKLVATKPQNYGSHSPYHEKSSEWRPSVAGQGDLSTPSGESSPCSPLLRTLSRGTLQVYARRWYILLLYSWMVVCLAVAGGGYGPVAHAAIVTFGWTNADLALLASWQGISFILFLGPFTWLLDVKGLRLACVLSAFFLFVGSGLRCITVEEPAVTWLNHAGQVLIGICSPAAYSGPSLVSSTWFPVEQRTTATAISSMAYGLGPAILFVLGPRIVPVQQPENNTQLPGNGTTEAVPTDDPPHIQDMKEALLVFNYVQFGMCASCFGLMLVYFPNKPPSPPSNSAAVDRTPFRLGIKSLFRNCRFWVLALVYSTTNGLFTTFAGGLDIDFIGAGIKNDQDLAGYMILGSVIACLLASIAVARIADVFMERIKPLMIGLCVAATALFLWFTALIEGIIPTHIPSLYVSFICGSVTINAAVPLFYELSCECTYPVSEGLTAGVLNLLNNFISLIFLYVFLVPGVGTSWMNWTMVGGVAVCIPILIPYKQQFTRRQFDQESTSDEVLPNGLLGSSSSVEKESSSCLPSNNQECNMDKSANKLYIHCAR